MSGSVNPKAEGNRGVPCSEVCQALNSDTVKGIVVTRSRRIISQLINATMKNSTSLYAYEYVLVATFAHSQRNVFLFLFLNEVMLLFRRTRKFLYFYITFYILYFLSILHFILYIFRLYDILYFIFFVYITGLIYVYRSYLY